MNNQRFNFLLLLLIGGFLICLVAASFIFRLFGYETIVTDRCFGIPCSWNVRLFTIQTQTNVSRVVIYAREKDGGHIFDGATIAVIEKTSGKILAEQIADQNGRVVFTLSSAPYRFQPSPLKENRVVGFLDANIASNQELTLRLTEIGPTAFGAPVQTCEAKKEAINLALEQVNYCETNSDCKLFQPDGFSCARFIHKSFDTSTILQRITDYGQSCKFTARKCYTFIEGQALCIQGKCKADYR